MDTGCSGGFQAAILLLPAFAVYLLGARSALVLTVLLLGALWLLGPVPDSATLLGATLPSGQMSWTLQVSVVFSLFGAWAVGVLHSSAREAAQVSFERALKELSDSEGKLRSLLESTDDMICSMDVEGRLVAINSAQKKLFRRRVGTEPSLGEYFFAYSTPERQKLWRQRFATTASGQPLRFEEEYRLDDACVTLEICLSPIINKEGRIVGLTLYSRDISARKESEARLGELHRTLVDISRQAGMAEIATGVLHNVGNTLNSVNISATVLGDMVRKSRVAGLAKAAQLLREHDPEFGAFLSSDPRGQKLPGYLIAVADGLVEEREAMRREVLALTESIEHIKSIVSMQQKHARTGGTLEQIQVPQLIDEALRLHAVSFERLGIRVERDYADVPPILVDRHKLLQILINLLSNAQQSLVESQKQDKRLSIRVQPDPSSQRLLLEVGDNGMGIAPENLSRVFTQGFTTKKTGHGFGLHISALSATEMKGRLTCSSPGPGEGATFTLELPWEVQTEDR
jgi:PAS domain S-box-containing protein